MNFNLDNIAVGDKIPELLIEPITNYSMIVIDKSFNQNSFLTFVNTNVNRKSNFRINRCKFKLLRIRRWRNSV